MVVIKLMGWPPSVRTTFFSLGNGTSIGISRKSSSEILFSGLQGVPPHRADLIIVDLDVPTHERRGATRFGWVSSQFYPGEALSTFHLPTTSLGLSFSSSALIPTASTHTTMPAPIRRSTFIDGSFPEVLPRTSRTIPGRGEWTQKWLESLEPHFVGCPVMHEEPTTVVIQRYLDALPRAPAAEPVIRKL